MNTITKSFLLFCFLINSNMLFSESLPNVKSGSIVRLNVASKYAEAKTVDVWLPPGYSTENKYSVVYMHDGQMLFDSTKTWNRKEWQVDEVAAELIKNGQIKDCIIAGVWNSNENRISEYMPTEIFNQLPDSIRAVFSEKYCNKRGAQGDAYLQFLVHELKPLIDSRFPTLPDAGNTIIMGSSMGGLISAYAICEYPGVFGKAACMSTSWLNFIDYRISLAALQYLSEHLPDCAGHQIYMDYGSGEADWKYAVSQQYADYIIKSKGFDERGFMSKVFENAIHDEISWSRRLHVPLEFLLKK